MTVRFDDKNIIVHNYEKDRNEYLNEEETTVEEDGNKTSEQQNIEK